MLTPRVLSPVCAFIGSYTMGWDMGVGEALQFGGVQSFLVGLGYFLALGLVFGVCGALAHWMSGTYGADVSPGHSFAFMSMVGTPLMIGGLLHLYPHAGLNILFLVPVAMWSVYLLYTGVPVVYGVNADRGMLMASSILGVLFVGVVAIMIATVVAWVHGFGPNLGFDWSSSLAG